MTKRWRLIQALSLHHSPGVPNIVSSPLCLLVHLGSHAAVQLVRCLVIFWKTVQMDQKETQSTCVRRNDASLFCCLTVARRKACCLFEQIPHPLAHVTRIRKAGLVLRWLADWPGVRRPPDKILLLQNHRTSRRGITCCLILLWEPDFLVVLFFFLDSLCCYTSPDLRDFFKKAYSSSLVSASSKKAQMPWIWLFLLKQFSVLASSSERWRRLIEHCLEAAL